MLDLKCVLPGRREDAFDLFATADRLAQWWGPAGFTIPSLDFVPRPGAAYRIEMQPPEGDSFYLRGEFREVEPPERLAFTFAWEDPDPDDVETLVQLSFTDLGDTTEVALEQGPFKTEARYELHHDGWSDSFAKLSETAERTRARAARPDAPPGAPSA
jgi:uncharacterized protein YndB with AHSA1/START domain